MAAGPSELHGQTAEVLKGSYACGQVGEAGQKVHVISVDRPTDSESVSDPASPSPSSCPRAPHWPFVRTGEKPACP